MIRLLQLPWPTPAVLVWLGAWGWYALLLHLGATMAWALLGGLAVSALASAWGVSGWRKALMGLGFPLSWVLTLGVAQVPAWAWLLLALMLLLLFPPTTWRDAPLFPTPAGALEGLPEVAPLAPMARILDAGAGAGDGLLALEQAYPDARLEGVERSWPVVWAARTRCPSARVWRADMWQHSWAGYDMVYLFQRPETMPRAAAKAAAELVPGAWLVSLEFHIPGWSATATATCPDGRRLWLYQAPFSGLAVSAL